MSDGKTWLSPLSSTTATATILAAWFSVWFVGFCMTAGTAAGSAYWMRALLNGGVAPFPTLPQGFAILVTVELWELFGAMPGFRFCLLLFGYFAAAVTTWQILRSQQPPVSLHQLLGPGRVKPWMLLTAVPAAGLIFGVQSGLGFSLRAVPAMHYEKQQVELFGLITSPDPVALAAVLLVCTILPFLEEILFRGLGYRSIRSRYGWPAAIVLSSLLFAAWHFAPNRWWLLVHTFFIGVVLALLYEWSGTLWLPVAAHGTHNLLLFLLSGALKRFFP